MTDEVPTASAQHELRDLLKPKTIAAAERLLAQRLAAGQATARDVALVMERLVELNRYPQALNFFRQARSEGLWEERMLRAALKVYIEEERFPEAIRALTDGLAAGHAADDTYAQLISALARHGRHADGEMLFQSARGAGVAGERTFVSGIQVLAGAADMRSAEERFSEACTRGLSSAAAYNVLIAAWGRVGDLSRAKHYFEGAEGAGLADQRTYSTYAGAVASVDAEQALGVLVRAIALSKASSAAFGVAVHALSRDGRLSKAREAFTMALESGHGGAAVTNALMHGYRRYGDLDAVEEVLVEAESHGAVDAESYDTAITALARGRRVDRALEVYRRASKRRVDDVAYGALALACARAGRPDEALAVYRAHRRNGRLNQDAYTAAVLAHIARGDVAGAQEAASYAQRYGFLSDEAHRALVAS